MSYAVPGLVLTDHELTVPLDHADPIGEQITVFAREVAEPEGREKPFLVYLQGGPGFEAPRPTGSPRGPAWLDRALQDFRVLMLDQRGTGRSTPVHGDRERRVPRRTSAPTRSCATPSCCARRSARRRGACSGRASAGCACSAYLSFAPEGLREAFVTGGVPGIGVPIDDVYRATFERDARAQPPLLRALPGGPRARARAGRAPRRATTCGCPTATR